LPGRQVFFNTAGNGNGRADLYASVCLASTLYSHGVIRLGNNCSPYEYKDISISGPGIRPPSKSPPVSCGGALAGGLRAAQYIKTSPRALCPSQRNIKTESECRAAASYLGYAFTTAYNGLNDHPYCHFDHRNLPGRQVFFNTAGNGNGRADLYASVCLTSVCSCQNGSPRTGLSCTSHGSNQCRSCRHGYWLSGNRCYLKGTVPKYIMSAVLCSRNIKTESECRAAASYLGYAFTQAYNGPNDHPYCHFDHRNLPGRQVFFNTAVSGKRSAYYESVCLANMCFCSNGTPKTGAACTSNNAHMCHACKVGYRLDGISCTARSNACKCSNGTPVTGSDCIRNGSPKCLSCNAGYTISTTRSSCLLNKCICANGKPVSGSVCRRNGALMCKACNGGFMLNTPRTACTTYVQRVTACVCKNGAAATGNACPQNGAAVCLQCNVGYSLNAATRFCSKASTLMTCRDPKWPSFPYLNDITASQWTSNVLFMDFIHASEMTFGFKPNEGAFDAMIAQLDPKNRPNCKRVQKKKCKPQYNACTTVGKKSVYKCSPYQEANVASDSLGFKASLGIPLCLQIDKGGKAVYQEDCNAKTPTKHVRGKLLATVKVSTTNIHATPSYSLVLKGSEFTPIPMGAMVDNIFDTIVQAASLPTDVIQTLATIYSPLTDVLGVLRIQNLKFSLKYDSDNSAGPKKRDFHFSAAGSLRFTSLRMSTKNPLQMVMSFIAPIADIIQPRLHLSTDVSKTLVPPKSTTTVKMKFGTNAICFDDFSSRDSGRDTDCDATDNCVAANTCKCYCNVRLDDREGGGFSLFMETELGRPFKISLGMETGVKVRIANEQFLHFVGKMSISQGPTASLNADLRMYGTWQHAFGISKLHMSDAVLSFGITQPISPASIVPNSLMIGATIHMGHSTIAKCPVHIGAYVGYDVNDPFKAFALMYGTRAPTLKQLAHTFLPSTIADKLLMIPGLSALQNLQLGPYNALRRKTCSLADITTIKGGCSGQSNAACYQLFQNCYFVAWAAPLGLEDVQSNLAGFKGPAAIISVLPKSSYFGASGSLTVGGVVVGAAFETGLVIPYVGTTRFKFRVGVRLFDFFLGEAYFSYDLGLDPKQVQQLQKSTATSNGYCLDKPPACKTINGKQQYPHCIGDKGKRMWKCKAMKPPSEVKQVEDMRRAIIKTKGQNPIFTIGGTLQLDMDKLKTKLKDATKALLQVSGLKLRLQNLLQHTSTICRKIGVPAAICDVVIKLASGFINTLVGPIISAVQTVLDTVANGISYLIDKLPDTSVAVQLHSKAQMKTSGLEVALSFLIETQKPDLKFRLILGTLEPFKGVKVGPLSLVAAAVEGLKDQIKQLVVSTFGDPVQLVNNALRALKNKVLDKGRSLMMTIVNFIRPLTNALRMTSTPKSAPPDHCNKQPDFGFSTCKVCAEADQSQYGPRRQHLVATNSDYESCFGFCLGISMRVYDAWAEATRFEAVKITMAPNWWNEHKLASVNVTGGATECEGLCVSDVDCVGYTYVESQFQGTTSGLQYCAARLPSQVLYMGDDVTAARLSLGPGSSSKQQAIIPMDGRTPFGQPVIGMAGDPHATPKSWSGGSMWWAGWNELNRLRQLCSSNAIKKDTCLLASTLPRHKSLPWKCRRINPPTNTYSAPFVDCSQKYWNKCVSKYETVDPATCNADGSCFYRRVTKANGTVTHKNPQGIIVDDKMASYRFNDGEVDTASIRDWTSGACCRHQRGTPYEVVAIGTECEGSYGARIDMGYKRTTSECAAACVGTNSHFFDFATTRLVHVNPNRYKCRCHKVGTKCKLRANSGVNLYTYPSTGHNNVCKFAPGSTATRKLNQNSPLVHDWSSAATGNVWCDATYVDSDLTTTAKGKNYPNNFRNPNVKYEPTRCISKYSSGRQ
jgi:hypothetical protein